MPNRTSSIDTTGTDSASATRAATVLFPTPIGPMRIGSFLAATLDSSPAPRRSMYPTNPNSEDQFMTLTKDQIDQFKRDGYVVVPGLLERREAEAMGAEIIRFQAEGKL